MLTPIRFDDLGRADYGWLKARYHFSFGDYFNPDRVEFGPLRVINDDRIRAGSGFDPHPHKDMEIITYVRSGAIIHRDSLGNEGRTVAGDVQVMSAGTGITHAEFSDPDVDTALYQIWIRPRERGVIPRWDQRKFPKDPVQGSLPLLVSGHERHAGLGALMIHQDAAIYGGQIEKGASITHALDGPAYVLVSEGQASINGVMLNGGDAAQISDESALHITAADHAELLVIAL